MRYLLIDIGNTAIKLGYFENNILIEKKTITHNDFLPLSPFLPDFIVLSNVAYSQEKLQILLTPYKNTPILHCKLNQNGELFFDSKKILLPIQVAYQTPHTLGSDRLASVLGAYALHPNQNVIVVDFGTCIKYELLTDKGIYLGGAISPGINMRYQAVHHFTAKLPLLSAPEKTPEPVGKTTDEAIHAGVVHAVYCEVKGMIQSYKDTLEVQDVVVLFSGGESQYLAGCKNLYTFATQNLVFTGLQLLAETCIKYMQER